ncbi:MAG: GNAT family N-acetyltransferase [Ktedonobacterales bacterium]
MTNIWRGKLARLRGVEPGDWEAHAVWNQESVMSRDLDHVWFPTSSASTRAWAEEMARRTGDDDTFTFEIEALSDGELVGHIATHQCDRRVGSFSYGVATLTEQRRRGYASEAILLVARYYFQELRYQKVNAQVYSYNAASLALHEKLGFTREGALRRMVYTGGRHYDLVAFGMTDDEFAARYPELVAAW